MWDKRRGFTIVEALVAITLLVTGAVFLVRGLGAMANAEAAMRDRVFINGLAKQKLQEMVNTQQYQSVTSGNFDDPNSMYTWTLTSTDSGITNVTGLQITVTRTDKTVARPGFAETLVFAPPPTTAGATGG